MTRMRFFSAIVFGIMLLVFFLPHSAKKSSQEPKFTCKQSSLGADETDLAFGAGLSCSVSYYRALTAFSGVSSAITDLKKRITEDEGVNEECHQIAHAIGRSAVENNITLAPAFAAGDPLCSDGYFHGVMEGIIQKRETKELSPEFLNGLCEPFRQNGASFADHYNCAHGIGHGIMYVNNNELFDALSTCDSLFDENEKQNCWIGVFMENVVTDFKDHTTKYLKPEEPMYPCSDVKEKYKRACYSFQSSYGVKVTNSFTETMTLCRGIPSAYKDVCFEGVGRDTVVAADADAVQAKKTCFSSSRGGQETMGCIIGAVKALIYHYHSDKESTLLCADFSEKEKETCLSASSDYYRQFRAEL